MDRDTAENIVVNAATIGISLTDLEAGMRIFALSIGLVFTIYKFYITYKNEKSGINKAKRE